MITGITSVVEPTHQDAIPLPKSVARKIAIATGLNICFLFMARMYFEAIDTKATIPTVTNSSTVVTGKRIKNSINDVIKYDSELTCTFNILANKVFDTKQTKTIDTIEMIKLKGL